MRELSMHARTARRARRLFGHLVAISVFVALGVEASAAAQGDLRRISLAQAIEIAMNSNRVLRAAELQRREASDNADVALGGMLPRIDAFENFSYSNNPTMVFSNLLNQQDFARSDFALNNLNYPSALSNFQSQFMFSQPIFAGGRLLAGFRRAGSAAQAQALRTIRTRQEITFAVVRTYYESVLAEQHVGVVERALAAAQAHRTQAQNMFDHGMVVRADLLRSEVMVGQLQQETIAARNQMLNSRDAFTHVLGAEDQPLAPVESPPELAMAVSQGREPLEHLVAAAQTRRPEVGTANAEVEQAQQAIQIARSEYLPEVNLATAYENDSRSLYRAGNSYSVFVSGKFNIFNGMATRAKVDAAQAALSRAKEMRAELVQAIALDVDTAYRALATARDSLDVAVRDEKFAAEALRILNDRYGGGLATNVEVLDAEAAHKQSDLRVVDARVAVQMSASALDLATAAPGFGGAAK